MTAGQMGTVGLMGMLLLTGCGPAAAPAPTPQQAAAPAKAPPTPPSTAKTTTPAAPPRTSPFWEETDKQAKAPSPINTASEPGPAVAASLPRPRVDEQKVAAAGIRKLEGRRLVLYTDLPADPQIDALCEIADQAWPQWCSYFQVAADEPADWQMVGCLMQEKLRFQAAGLYPDDLTAFHNGFCRDQQFWLYEQPTDYYRRHLLLHEMTHGFMYTRLATSAPPWYLEGIAELLATHRIVDGKLQMNHFPQRREETPDWGRIKLVQDGFTANKALFLNQVLEMPLEAHLQVENYGWCWAAAALLDGHPRYRERFRQVARDVAQPDFAGRFRALFARDWKQLDEVLQLFVGWMEYGYDLERSAVDFQAGEELPEGGAKCKLAADRTWQSSRLRLEGGKAYRIRASGRYEVAQAPRPWISEPGGVSIRYYKRAPLGILAAAVRPDVPDENAASSFFRFTFVGLESVITPSETGTLYLRINDSNAELADNRGELEVEVLPD